MNGLGTLETELFGCLVHSLLREGHELLHVAKRSLHIHRRKMKTKRRKMNSNNLIAESCLFTKLVNAQWASKHT
jgi:hypothetical protein